MKKISSLIGLFIVVTTLAVPLYFLGEYIFNSNVRRVASVADQTQTEAVLFYQTKVQPVLTQRCAVCHSCLNAPCQLNLSSYEGFLRGANKHNVYETSRLEEAPLTRIGVDAQTLQDWRDKKNFYAVHDSKNPGFSLFTNMIALKTNSNQLPVENVEDSVSCPANFLEMQKYATDKPNAGMPYGLPSLNDSEKSVVNTWISKGAQGPSWEQIQKDKIPSGPSLVKIRQWENVLNLSDLKHKLVSRYLFEHLFIAHIYFTEQPQTFYSLVRSKTACETGVDVISSRRPNSDPEVANFYYCFQKITAPIVDKTHLPYEISPNKLNRINTLFFKPDWSVATLPDYSEKNSANPFITFHAIPAKSRYQFLLDDSQYHVNTFIKGPVCFGSTALNSIDEQFFTFFINPNSDFASTDPDFESVAANNLFLPSYYSGSQVKLKKVLNIYSDMVDRRETYRSQVAQVFRKKFPKGYNIKDLWDGDGFNDNAVLTIMRHKNSSSVLKGARGELSKTAFVLDYPLFERLVYDLVVGYDVYGNVGHQLLSRIYMDFIRMEAEENYLLFMPPNKVRKSIRKYWYRGVFAHLKMKFWYKHHNLDVPTQMQYNDPKNAQAEFAEQVLFNYMNPQVRGPIDIINWKKINARSQDKNYALSKMSDTEKLVATKLSKVASVKGSEKPFSVYFPDLAFLKISTNSSTDLSYTFVHHKEHRNLAVFVLEESRRDPYIDSLSIFRGFVGPFPNYFFAVNINNLDQFVTDMQNIKTKADYEKFKLTYGVARTNPDFWTYSDWFNADAKKLNPVDSGLFDLTRYDDRTPESSVKEWDEDVRETLPKSDDEDKELGLDSYQAPNIDYMKGGGGHN